MTCLTWPQVQLLQESLLRQIHTEHPEAMYPAASCALGDLCEVTLADLWTLDLCRSLQHELKRTGSCQHSQILDATAHIAIALETLPAVLILLIWILSGSFLQVGLSVRDGTCSISKADLGRRPSAQFIWSCFSHPPDMLTVLILSLPPALGSCLELRLITYTHRQRG